MKKQICTSLISLVVAGASQGVAAEGWELPGFSSDDYQTQPTLALVAGGMDPDFASAGSGPDVGVRDVKTGSREDALLGGQAGASVHFHHGAFFFGGEARYQATAGERFGARGWDADNVRVLLKVGVNL